MTVWLKRRWNSLFTTGGQRNPLATIIYVGIILYGFNDFRNWMDKRHLVKDCNIIQSASADKVQKINEARHEQTKASEAIDNGTFNDWLERVQHDTD